MGRFSFIAFILIVIVGVELSAAEAQEKFPFTVPKNPLTLPESALIETSQGALEIEFFRQDAPITVANFEYLAKKGFYNNVAFRRYLPGFIIQGGDPTGTGKGGPGYTLPPEFSQHKHVKGMVGMSRHPNEVNSQRRSNGSQFYITLGNAPHLDGFYTLFARVINGMDVVEKLRAEDKILNIRFPRNEPLQPDSPKSP